MWKPAGSEPSDQVYGVGAWPSSTMESNSSYGKEGSIDSESRNDQMSRYSMNNLTEKNQRNEMTGRLILGPQPLRHRNINDVASDENNGDSVIYVTRHTIDHVRQSVGVCREVMLAECVPCCDREAREKRNIGTGLIIWMLWSIIRSEIFIYGLHNLILFCRR